MNSASTGKILSFISPLRSSVFRNVLLLEMINILEEFQNSQTEVCNTM